MASRSDSILIIGGDSFTGYHLSNYLVSKGYSVTSTSHSNASAGFIPLNILDRRSLDELLTLNSYDCIINLAAASFAADENRHQFYQVNVLGTENILEALVRSGKSYKKILMPSSATVYGPQGLEILDESLVPSPVGHYAYSKFVGEMVCRTYFDKLNIVIPRPFNYTGVGQDQRFLVPKIVEAFSKKADSINLGNLDTYREYNDVRQVCEIYECLLRSQFSSDVVNVATGVAYSARNIIDILETLSCHSLVVNSDPKFFRSSEVRTLVGCNKKLSSVCGGGLAVETSLKVILKTMLN